MEADDIDGNMTHDNDGVRIQCNYCYAGIYLQ